MAASQKKADGRGRAGNKDNVISLRREGFRLRCELDKVKERAVIIFKCKICGGDLEVSPTDSVTKCPYCDTRQTLPKLDDDKRANLYDRANHARRNNEYDKAAGMYEAILQEDYTDPEAYWSLVLCKYGVEYVEDPHDKRRIPTCNRTSVDSVLTDGDYLSTLKYADVFQKEIYEQEARVIDGIQKDILSISSKEKPFDVFVCYKQADDTGARSRDSVLAHEIYSELTDAQLRVFFAEITLENALGSEYVNRPGFGRDFCLSL